ncbi:MULTISPECIES: Na+/H+ antiporter NhaC family protein [unclassified Peribacillus]|uniref:Na+/H+ antiporter NhaC family protein n=1 Tax=unclassified Peribacillus TaxID=2675266 RepID=UPI00366F2A69
MVIALITNMIGLLMLLTSIVAGSLMKNVFKNNNFAPENFSRNIEDVETMGAPVIPWNSNAIYCSQMRGSWNKTAIPSIKTIKETVIIPIQTL